MPLRRRGGDPSFPKDDRGSGSLADYRFDLVPSSRSITIRLAGSDPHQDVIAQAEAAVTLTTALGRRSDEDERTDAPIPVRLFADGRVLGPVGLVPRGLEGAVTEAITRLELAGRAARIPVEIARTRHGLRVDLMMGLTR